MVKPSDYKKAEGYRELSAALGIDVANALIAHTINTLSIEDISSLSLLLKLECKKLTRISQHFLRLRPHLTNIKNESASLEDMAREAAQWIIKASNSGTISESNLQHTILNFLHFRVEFRSFHDVVQLHKRVAPNASLSPRGIIPNDSPLSSSFSGQALFDYQLRISHISAKSPAYPQYLFGWLVGWHPFPDGNGRTARAAYAISSIQKNCWRPLSEYEEDSLSGL